MKLATQKIFETLSDTGEYYKITSEGKLGEKPFSPKKNINFIKQHNSKVKQLTSLLCS